MIEQIRIHGGKLYIAQDFSYDLDRYKGEPFKDEDGHEVVFPFDGFLNTDGLTEAEQWILDNIKPEKLDDDLYVELYKDKRDYDSKDYFK